MPKTFYGLRSHDHRLVRVSQFNSQVEGSEFDGPILFQSMDDLKEAIDDMTIQDEYTPVIVTLSVRDLNSIE